MAFYEEGASYDETPEVTEPEAMNEGATDDESVDMREFAEPEAEDDDQGAAEEEPAEEVADVPEGKRSRDSAFAEMRRAREAAEAERDEYRAQIEELQRQEREAELIRAAEEMGLSDEEIDQVLADAEEAEEAEAERSRLFDENERLNQELLDVKVSQAMAQDLRDIQAIDPSVKSLDDLGEDFYKFRAALPGIDAYFAVKSKQERTGYGAAPTMGRANQAAVQRDYYTSEELDNMSQEEILANMDKVRRSLDRL